MKKQISWINGLKGIACMGIVLTHFPVGVTENESLTKIVRSGARGVQLFFIISTFLIFLSLQNSFGDKKISFKEGIQWLKWKIIRLIPLYYLAIITAYAINYKSNYWLGSHEKVSILNVVFHILLLHGLNPFYANSIIGVEWYIGVLVILYLISPMLYNTIKSLDSAMLVGGISIFVSVIFRGMLRQCLQRGADNYIWISYIDTFSIIAQFPIMMFGIIFYFIYIKQTTSSKKISFGIFIVSLYAIIVLVNKELSDYVFWGVTCLGIMISLLNNRNILIDNPVFNLIGKYSYGIYLFHYFVINKLSFYNSITNIWIRYLCGYSAVLLISSFLAYFSTKFVEKPIIKFVQYICK